MTTIQGKTKGGNNVIVFQNKNIYFSNKGKILGMEDAFFIPENAFTIPNFVGEYYLKLAQQWAKQEEIKEKIKESKRTQRRNRQEIFLDLKNPSHRVTLYGNPSLEGRFGNSNIGVNLHGDFPRAEWYMELPYTVGSYYRRGGEDTHKRVGTVIQSDNLSYGSNSRNYQTKDAKSLDILRVLRRHVK